MHFRGDLSGIPSGRDGDGAAIHLHPDGELSGWRTTYAMAVIPLVR
jgi:hypothetical protein